MELKNYFAQDEQGNLLANATCLLYLRGTESLVTGLQDATGQALSNPFSSNGLGLIQFAAPNGLYDLRVLKANRDYRIRVQMADLGEAVEEAAAQAERATDEADRSEAAVAEADKFQQQGIGAVIRSLKEKARERVTPMDLGAAGNGVTNDTAIFLLLASAFQRRVIDLAGRTYLVDDYPAGMTFQNPNGNLYQNGYFVIPGKGEFAAEYGCAFIADPTDTGQLTGGNTAGTIVKPGPYGRSNFMTMLIMACGSSRAWLGGGAVGLGCIHSEIRGNRSLAAASRLALVYGAQSAAIASEEPQVLGPKGVMIGCIMGRAAGEHGTIVAARNCETSGSHNFVAASEGSAAGGGKGAEFIPVVVNGSIDSMVIKDGGIGYPGSGTMVIWDKRSPGLGAGASFTFTTDSNGKINSTTKVSGGSNYGDVVEVYILGTGIYSGILFSVGGNYTYGERTMIAGGTRCIARYTASFLIGSDDSSTEAAHAFVIAGQLNVSSGQYGGSIGCSSTTVSGVSSLALTGSSLMCGGNYSLVAGRRTRNDSPYTWAWGNGSAGGASTANRTVEMDYNAGNLKIKGNLTQNGTFTDIAKMFENVAGEIPIGAMVAWEGRQVRLAQPGDKLFSVHSRTYALLLGDSTFTWSKRYLTGEFGQDLYHDIPDPDWRSEIPDPNWPEWVQNPQHPQFDAVEQVDVAGNPTGGVEYELISHPMMANPVPRGMIPNPVARGTITVQIENPDYDHDQVQIPRSQRPDWTPVAMEGEVHTRVDASLQVGDFVMPVAPGIGGKADQVTPMYCMEITRPYDAEKGYAVALCLRTAV